MGQKDRNNGVLILVKPKTADSRGEVQITTGYGLEGAIPDLLSGEIVDREILPSFRNGNYYEGLNKAVNTMMSLARKEFSASEYHNKAKKSSGKNLPFGLIIFIVFIIIAMVSKGSGGSNNRHISTGGLPFWMLMGMMNSGRGSGGSWGGFSGGSSSGGGLWWFWWWKFWRRRCRWKLVAESTGLRAQSKEKSKNKEQTNSELRSCFSSAF